MKRRPKRKMLAPELPMQRVFDFGEAREQGRWFHLRKIFDKLNARYFRGRIRNFRVKWGRRRTEKPVREMVFAVIQEEDREIRVNPALDRWWVPRWFLEYVMYHEMCHIVVRDRYTRRGRRLIHHEGFTERERQFRGYWRAKRWEQENLARFLA